MKLGNNDTERKQDGFGNDVMVCVNQNDSGRTGTHNLYIGTRVNFNIYWIRVLDRAQTSILSKRNLVWRMFMFDIKGYCMLLSLLHCCSAKIVTHRFDTIFYTLFFIRTSKIGLKLALLKHFSIFSLKCS